MTRLSLKGPVFVLALVLFNSFHAYCEDTIYYHIAFPNAIHHEAEISITIENPGQEVYFFQMSRTSPGRYAVHNFGKNVYSVKAGKSDESVLEVVKTEPDVWKVKSDGETFTLSYTLYANRADGTYSGISDDFVLLNMPATMMWTDAMISSPAKIAFDLKGKGQWKIGTQLKALDSAKHIYFAPDFQSLMDSPCLIGDLKFTHLEFDQDEMPEISMAIYTNDSDADIETLKVHTQNIVLEQAKVFGALPQFENNKYIFLLGLGAGFYPDGMEHRNSTVITDNLTISGNMDNIVAGIAHEFFHVWNVERIRPASIEPFDFTKPVLCSELWFAEGFTSYNADLTICRAGIIGQERYLGVLGVLLNYCMNGPGIHFGSPVYMSEMATYTDQAAFMDDTNFNNTHLSYYRYGELIALALDLSLRSQFKSKSLDDVMKAMWLKYGVEEKPYSNQDIEKTLAEVCDNETFAKEFFNKYVYNNEIPDFENLFNQFGYKLIKKNPDRSSLGFVRLRFEGDTAIVLSDPQIGNGLYDAGVNKGDLILSIDDQPVTSYPELNFIIGTRKVGDELVVRYVHLGKERSGTFKVKEDNQLILIPKERFSIKVKEEEEKRLNNWLNTRK